MGDKHGSHLAKNAQGIRVAQIIAYSLTNALARKWSLQHPTIAFMWVSSSRHKVLARSDVNFVSYIGSKSTKYCTFYHLLPRPHCWSFAAFGDFQLVVFFCPMSCWPISRSNRFLLLPCVLSLLTNVFIIVFIVLLVFGSFYISLFIMSFLLLASPMMNSWVFCPLFWVWMAFVSFAFSFFGFSLWDVVYERNSTNICVLLLDFLFMMLN